MLLILYDNIINVNSNLGGFKMNKRLQWSQYMGFITIGLIANIIGPMLSIIKVDIKMNYSQAGLILSGQFIGMLLTVLVGGFLADKYGKKLFLIGGGIFLFIGLIGCMLSFNFLTLLICTLISGIGYGTYSVGINALCSDVTEDNKGGAMNFLHFFFGFGAIFGPILVTVVISVFHNWRVVYGFVALLPLIVTYMLWPIVIKKKKSEVNTKNALPYKNSFIWISGLFCFIYVGIETSSYGWIPTYWGHIAPKSIIPATLIGTVFFITLTLGRLFSGFIVDKIGFSRFLIIASLGVLIVTLGWVFIPFKACTIIAMLLLGLFLAGIYPTNMASVTSEYPYISAEISAFIAVFSALGGSAIPSAIGKSADVIGIDNIPLIICGLAFLLLIFAYFRMKSLKQ
jgi:MFS family permease